MGNDTRAYFRISGTRVDPQITIDRIRNVSSTGQLYLWKGELQLPEMKSAAVILYLIIKNFDRGEPEKYVLGRFDTILEAYKAYETISEYFIFGVDPPNALSQMLYERGISVLSFFIITSKQGSMLGLPLDWTMSKKIGAHLHDSPISSVPFPPLSTESTESTFTVVPAFSHI